MGYRVVLVWHCCSRMRWFFVESCSVVQSHAVAVGSEKLLPFVDGFVWLVGRIAWLDISWVVLVVLLPVPDSSFIAQGSGKSCDC